MKLIPRALRHDAPSASDDVVVVQLPSAHHPGDLDAIQTALETPLGRGQVRLAVDVTTAEFVCTTAVGYLVFCIKRARDGGGDVRFFGAGAEPDGPFHKLIEVCAVEAMFRIYRDRDAAVTSFDAPA